MILEHKVDMVAKVQFLDKHNRLEVLMTCRPVTDDDVCTTYLHGLIKYQPFPASITAVFNTSGSRAI